MLFYKQTTSTPILQGCTPPPQHQGKAKGTHVLIGFEDLALVRCPLGGKLTPLPESSRRSVRASVAQVPDLFLNILYTLSRTGHQH